jgi:DNA-binding transcriptional regulator YbjK
MSPRTKEQNDEIRKRRTQEILQAAILVYAEKGFSASEIGEVAERAGIWHASWFTTILKTSKPCFVNYTST